MFAIFLLREQKYIRYNTIKILINKCMKSIYKYNKNNNFSRN